MTSKPAWRPNKELLIHSDNFKCSLLLHATPDRYEIWLVQRQGMMFHASEDLMRMRRIVRMSRDLQFKVYFSKP